MKPVPYSHCSFCGTKYGNEDWPRACPEPECKASVWRNPLPVCVALMRVGDGILGVRRGIKPRKGDLCLVASTTTESCGDKPWHAS